MRQFSNQIDHLARASDSSHRVSIEHPRTRVPFPEIMQPTYQPEEISRLKRRVELERESVAAIRAVLQVEERRLVEERRKQRDRLNRRERQIHDAEKRLSELKDEIEMLEKQSVRLRVRMSKLHALPGSDLKVSQIINDCKTTADSENISRASQFIIYSPLKLEAPAIPPNGSYMSSPIMSSSDDAEALELREAALHAAIERLQEREKEFADHVAREQRKLQLEAERVAFRKEELSRQDRKLAIRQSVIGRLSESDAAKHPSIQ